MYNVLVLRYTSCKTKQNSLNFVMHLCKEREKDKAKDCKKPLRKGGREAIIIKKRKEDFHA